VFQGHATCCVWAAHSALKCAFEPHTLNTHDNNHSGFPGETAAQHSELVAFVKAFKFERMGCFTFSEEVRSSSSSSSSSSS